MNRPIAVTLKPSYANLDGAPDTRRVSIQAVQKAIDQRKPPAPRVAYLRKLTEIVASAWTDEGKFICNFTWAPCKAFKETDHIQIC